MRNNTSGCLLKSISGIMLENFRLMMTQAAKTQ